MRHTRRLLILLALALLTACGGAAQSPTAQPEATQPATQAAATAPATAASATLLPATAAPGATEAATPAGADSLVRGRTAEGYHALGRADAPVTITFYSDFF